MKHKSYIKGIPIVICLLWSFSAYTQYEDQGWERMEDMPVATGDFGSCMDAANNKVYVFGGDGTEGQFLGNTQIYNLETNEWETGANMPNTSLLACVEMINGKIYVFGDFYVEQFPHPITQVKEYDPANDSWSILGDLPAVFLASGYCVLNDIIYVFGGRDENMNTENWAWSYDPASDNWTELNDMPFDNVIPAVCEYNDEIYIFGKVGTMSLGSRALKYSPANDSYIVLNTGENRVRGGSVPIVFQDMILLFGGHNLSETYYDPLNSIWAYLPEADIMVFLDTMPFRRNTKGYIYENYMYLFGGYYEEWLGAVTNEVWRFDLDFLPPVSTIEINNTIKKEFMLYQNYPNPFSGSTIISYKLLEPAAVTIDIFDIMGKKIASLDNGYRGIGEYEIEWNAKGLKPGIYYARLSTGNMQQTIKMIISP